MHTRTAILVLVALFLVSPAVAVQKPPAQETAATASAAAGAPAALAAATAADANAGCYTLLLEGWDATPENRRRAIFALPDRFQLTTRSAAPVYPDWRRASPPPSIRLEQGIPPLWRPADPDSVVLFWTLGSTGVELRLGAADGVLRGRARAFGGTHPWSSGGPSASDPTAQATATPIDCERMPAKASLPFADSLAVVRIAGAAVARNTTDRVAVPTRLRCGNRIDCERGERGTVAWSTIGSRELAEAFADAAGGVAYAPDAPRPTGSDRIITLSPPVFEGDTAAVHVQRRAIEHDADYVYVLVREDGDWVVVERRLTRIT